MFRLFRKRKPTAKTGGDDLLKKLDGKELTYVTLRAADESGTVVEHVIGKQGRLNVADGVFHIVCDGSPVFSCPVDTAEYGELMSLAGVIITGDDRKTGERRTVVAYYQYYR